MPLSAIIEARFNHMVERMQAWREADHADSIVFSRNDIVTLLEGIKELQSKQGRQP